jgi:DNA-binding PadR family transcriptional regulator
VKPPSELEGVCLGLIHKLQPCTAYQVRRALKDSPSSHWQASAGSVYPLLARLEEAALIRKTADKNDGRGRKFLRLTPAGRQGLKHWIRSGSQPDLVAAIMDPVRSRMFFLGVLSPPERRRHIGELVQQVERHLEEVVARLERSPDDIDLFDHLGALGALHLTEARLEWLKRVRKRLASGAE